MTYKIKSLWYFSTPSGDEKGPYPNKGSAIQSMLDWYNRNTG